MAKAKEDARADRVDMKQNAKVADIVTAAKSLVGEGDYAEGYPAQPGALHNKNFSHFTSGKK